MEGVFPDGASDRKHVEARSEFWKSHKEKR